MIVQRTQRGPGWIQFPVDDVEPAVQALPEVRTHEALRELVDGPLEACCDYSRPAVAGVRHQPLLEAVHRAYAEHRPLVLGPDHVWLTIAQGFAAHVNAEPERLRRRLVHHGGRERLGIEVPAGSLPPGSPENDWPGLVIGPLSDALRARIDPELHDLLVPTFSTTGPLERTAFQVALLEAHQPYFDFVARFVCGIPWVRLEGTLEDWRKVRSRALRLRSYELAWWIDALRPVLDQLVRAAAGSVDRAFWQRIYKIHRRYGGLNVNGWFLALVPYLKDTRGQLTVRNPILQDPTKDFGPNHFHPGGVSHDSLPTGISKVRVDLEAPGGDVRPIDVLAGFVGVEQGHGYSLRPRIGWAVRPAPRLDVAIERISAGHACRSPASVEGLSAHWSAGIPHELVQLYTRFDGAHLHPGTSSSARILPVDQLRHRSVEGRPWWIWVEWCELFGGSRLGIRAQAEEEGRIALFSARGNRLVAPDLAAALELLLGRTPLPDLGPVPGDG